MKKIINFFKKIIGFFKRIAVIIKGFFQRVNTIIKGFDRDEHASRARSYICLIREVIRTLRYSDYKNPVSGHNFLFMPDGTLVCITCKYISLKKD